MDSKTSPNRAFLKNNGSGMRGRGRGTLGAAGAEVGAIPARQWIPTLQERLQAMEPEFSRKKAHCAEERFIYLFISGPSPLSEDSKKLHSNCCGYNVSRPALRKHIY